jgi:transposase
MKRRISPVKGDKLLVTQKDIKRFKVLKDVIEKRLKSTEAAQLLGLSIVHISRLKKRLQNNGFEGLLRRPALSPPGNKISERAIKTIIRLRRKFYYDFNIMHFRDKLREDYKLVYSYEALRQILIHHKEYVPKKRKKVHRQRRRMPKAGLLVQMDSSQHRWLPKIKEKWWLVAMIDDATNEIPYAHLFPGDTLFANMHVLRRFIEIKGLFMALYVDKASHFKTTRHGGLNYTVDPEQSDTQIERAMEELGINIIWANSPQAKGRIEVTFRLFQDRFIKEMRLAKIKTYAQANEFLLNTFLPWYNARYTHQAESGYMPLPKNQNLDLIFCDKKTRRVSNDNTIQIHGQTVQIPPSRMVLSFSRKYVDVCILHDRRILVVYKGQIIAEAQLAKNNKTLKKEKIMEKLLNQREHHAVPIRNIYHPPNNHPWRKFVYGKSKTLEK